MRDDPWMKKFMEELAEGLPEKPKDCWYAAVHPKTRKIAFVENEADRCDPWGGYNGHCGGCGYCMALQADYAGFDLVYIEPEGFETFGDAFGRAMRAYVPSKEADRNLDVEQLLKGDDFTGTEPLDECSAT